MPPSIGPPATILEVANGGNCCAHAPFGPPSRIPFQTSLPCASSEPSVAKHESTASAGLFPATPRTGWASMFASHSSSTSSACGVWSKRGADGPAAARR